jgi:hypothetical protein
MRRVRHALPWIGFALVIGVGGALLLDGIPEFVAEAAAVVIVLIALLGRTDDSYQGRQPPTPPGSGPAHTSGMG